ncbi:MAG: hypothetical protein Q7S28_04005 [bacterium]|nr:hypothetical protein [bacterium]
MNPEQSYFKRFLFAGILFVAVFAGIGWWQWNAKYGPMRKAQKMIAVEQAAEYARAMADTYGGKTPQETLQMYIDAVEKGDYDLASKYFIEVYKEKELRILSNSTQENMNKLTQVLNESLKSSEFTLEGSFSTGQEFSIYKPILLRFRLYPNGIWKIVEI